MRQYTIDDIREAFKAGYDTCHYKAPIFSREQMLVPMMEQYVDSLESEEE